MDGSMWKRVLLHWVKHTEFLEGTFYNLEQTDVEEFFSKFFDRIKEGNSCSKDIILFLKEQYPQFEPHLDDDQHISSVEYMYIYSLLLHYSCVKHPQEYFQKACQKLTEEYQHLIAYFFQILLERDTFTKESLRNTIAGAVSKSPVPLSTFSPLRTPNSKQSPPTPATIVTEHTKQIIALKRQIEAERYDKSFLEIQLKETEAQNEKLKRDKKKYSVQIAELKSELLTNTTENRSPYKNIKEEQIKYRLRKEITEKDEKILNLQEHIQGIEKEKNIIREKLHFVESTVNIYMDKIQGMEDTINDLTIELENKNDKITSLNDIKNELERYLNEGRAARDLHTDINSSGEYLDISFSRTNNSSGTMPSPENLAGSVVDVKLREKEIENGHLREEIDHFRTVLKGLHQVLVKNINIFNIEDMSTLLQHDNDLIKFEDIVDHLSQIFETIKCKVSNAEKMYNDALKEKKEADQFINKLKEEINALLDKIQNNEKEIKHLKDNLEQNHKKYAELAIKNSLLEVNYENDKKCFGLTIDEHKEEINILVKKMENYEKEIQNLKGSLENSQKHYAELGKQHSLLEMEYEKEKKCSGQTINELKEEMNILIKEIENSKKEIKHLEDNLEQSCQKYAELLQENSLLKAKYAKEKMHADKSLNDLKEEMNVLVKKMENNEKEMLNLKDNLESSQKHCAELGKQHSLLEMEYEKEKKCSGQTINELKEEMNILIKEIENSKKEIKLLEDNLEQSNQKYAESLQENSLLKAKYAKEKMHADKSLNDLKEEMNLLVKNMENNEKEMLNLKDNLENSQKHYAELCKQHSSLEMEYENEKKCSGQTINELKEEMNILIKEIENSKKEIKLLEDNLEQSSQKYAESLQENSLLKAKYAKEKMHADKSLNDLKEEINVLVKKMENNEKEMLNLKDNLENSQKHYAELCKQHSSLEMEYENEKKCSGQTINSLKEEINILKDKILNYEEEIKCLQDNLKLSRQDYAELIEQNSTLETKYTNEKMCSDQYLNKLKREIDVLIEKNEHSQNEIKCLQDNLEKCHKNHAELAQQKSLLEIKYEDLNKDYSILMKEKCIIQTEKQNIVENLEKELLKSSLKTDEISRLHNQCQSLQQTLNEYKEQIKSLSCLSEERMNHINILKKDLNNAIKSLEVEESKNIQINNELKGQQSICIQLQYSVAKIISIAETYKDFFGRIFIDYQNGKFLLKTLGTSLKKITAEKLNMYKKFLDLYKKNSILLENFHKVDKKLLAFLNEYSSIKDKNTAYKNHINEIENYYKEKEKHNKLEIDNCKKNTAIFKSSLKRIADLVLEIESQLENVKEERDNFKIELINKDTKLFNLESSISKLNETCKNLLQHEDMHRIYVTDLQKLLKLVENVCNDNTKNVDIFNEFNSEITLFNKLKGYIYKVLYENFILQKNKTNFEHKIQELYDKIRELYKFEFLLPEDFIISHSMIIDSDNRMLKYDDKNLELEEKLSALKEYIQKSEFLRNKVMEDNETFKGEIKRLNLNVEEMQKAQDDLLKKVENLLNESSSDKKKITSFENIIQQLKDNKITIETQISDLKNENLILTQQKCSLQSRYKENEFLYKEAKLNLENFQSNCKDHIRELGREKESNACILKENTILKTELDKKLVELKNFEEKYMKRTHIIDNMETEKATLLALVDEQSKKIDNLNHLIEENCKVIQENKDEYFALEQKYSKIVAENMINIQKLKEVNCSLEKTSFKLGELQGISSKLTKQNTDLYNENEVLLRKIDSYKKMESRNMILELDITKLQKEFSLKDREIQAKNTNYIELQENLKKIESENKVFKEKTDQLTSEIIVSNELNKQLSEKFEKLTTNCEKLQQNNFDSEHQIKCLQQKIVNQSEEFEKYKKDILNLHRLHQSDILSKLDNLDQIVKNKENQIKKLVFGIDNIKSLTHAKNNLNSEKCKIISDITEKLQKIEHMYTKEKFNNEKLLKDLSIFEAKLHKNRQISEQNEVAWRQEKEKLLHQNELVENRIKETRLELEGKLEKMKNKMKTLYNEEVAKIQNKHERDIQELKLELKSHAEKAQKYEKHSKELSKQIFKLNETNLLLQKQNKFMDIKLKEYDFLSSDSRKNHHNFAVNTPALSSNILMEDEEGEIFNNTYLADLQYGRMSPFGRESVSAMELQYRNSLAPPHLRSTYCAQYADQHIREEDIKDHFQTNLNESLTSVATMGQRKKMTGTTSYKKPGPPTPSKNAGRLSFGSDLHPKDVLKENNDAGTINVKRPTPSKFKNIFHSSKSKDENTPPRRRLSNLFKTKR